MRILIFSALICLSGCVETIVQQPTEPINIIAKHTEAFNRGDIAAMSALQHPDIEWLSVSGKNISTQVAGRDAIAENMKDYFKSPTKVTGSLRDWGINYPYVSVTETANWTTKDGTKKSQSSLTVYEMEEGLIRRVWYYPAVQK